MLRRRRRTREIPFSFDSFLDIVANVVGVIIRLILVVWVGARSYSALKHLPPADTPRAGVAEPIYAAHEDPVQYELTHHERELARLQAELLAHLQQVETAGTQRARTEQEFAHVAARRREVEREAAALHQEVAGRGRTAEAAALSLAELRRRQARLREELRALERLPVTTKTLRYRTPVSQPVHAEQLMFELRAGRITFLDIAALIAEARLSLEERGRELRTARKVEAVAGPVGAFRLRYTLERERGVLDSLGAAPETETNYRYGLTEWRVEPVAGTRGETADQALVTGSALRQIVDALDPRQAVVTIWVYPDSFAAYRRLRDYLHDRDVVVAGRPLPAEAPIAGSPHGSASRGQ